jgi:HK97 family phage portal protein
LIDRLKNFFFRNTSYTTGSAEEILRRLVNQQRSSSGVYVDEQVAMRFATVWACVRLLSDTVAQMPCKLYRSSGGETEILYDSPIHRAISVRPEPGLTAFDFWKKFVSGVLLEGYSVAKKIESGNEFRLVPVSVTRMERTAFGEYIFRYLDSNGSEKRLLQNESFFAFYALDKNLLPVSPIRAQANAIGLGISAEGHGASTLAKNATPAGILEYPGALDAKVKDSLKKGWDKAYGPNGDGGVAILEGGAKFHPTAMSNEDAQLLQTRQFQKQEICGIYGVPPHLISDTTQAKGWSTMEQLMTEFVSLTVTPITIRIEQAISSHLLIDRKYRDAYAKFSTNGLLRGDIRTRTAFYTAGIDKGFLLKNEVRAFEDLNPLKGTEE